MSQALIAYTFPSGQSLEIVQGDITLETVDVIVNAANTHLEHGAGVAGAIVRKGGPVIQAESSQWVREHGPVTHTKPAFTHAGNLACRFVIHAVGPVWGEGDEDEKLRAAIHGSLHLADQLGAVSIAFPALSTGIFGFPKGRAAQVIIAGILDFIEQTPTSSLKLIRLVLFDQETVQVFLKVTKASESASRRACICH
jgi:O-acetyl-ADP-ribose deacetylase (regulator of RNase III)